MTRTLAENVAKTLGQWRQTGQTTMLCEVAKIYGGSYGSDVCIVTATEAYADQLRRDHGVVAKSVQTLEYYRGRRGVLFLLDNQVLLQLGDEHHALARELECTQLQVSIKEAKLHHADIKFRDLQNDLSSSEHRNQRLSLQLAKVEKKLADLQFVRSRRARRKRKRRSKA